jgi:hypothetical protein
MFVLIAFVVLAIAPDKPLKLVSQNRFATAQECEKAAAQIDPQRVAMAYKGLGLDADVQIGCAQTGQQDI